MERKTQEISDEAHRLLKMAAAMLGENQYALATRWVIQGYERDVASTEKRGNSSDDD